MSISIIMLPLISSIGSGIFGRHLGGRGAGILGTMSVGIGAIISWIVGYKVISEGIVININLIENWIESGGLSVSLGVRIDSLTAVMLILITTISTLVHLYSIGYMGEDPHIGRFMSYLSLFTFFMIVLVTGENLIQLFWGWEGEEKGGLRDLYKKPIKVKNYATEKLSKRYKKECELTSEQKEVLIGDGHLERRKLVENLRELYGSIVNMEPGILTRKDKRSQTKNFWTLMLPCLNPYYELFNKDRVKKIPPTIGELLTERGIGDGMYVKRGGVKFCTDCYTLEEIELLISVLTKKFGLLGVRHKRREGVYRT